MGGVKVALWAPAHLTKDRLFEVNRDDCLASFRALKGEVEKNGGLCHTSDWYRTEHLVPEIVIFMDIPKEKLADLLGPWYEGVRRWVILQEPPIVIPRNFEVWRHQEFERIFTWYDRFLGDPRYRKLNYGHRFPAEMTRGNPRTKKLCTMIAGNRRSAHPLELYSEREKAVRWFEKTHPEDFDLYGFGWDRRVFGGNRLMRGLNRLGWLTRLTAPQYPSWRGTVREKKQVLEQYRFAICYENCRDVPGYITEKIFDCFFAGCIPVYWGADNITAYIPEGCFIDRRGFDSDEELYRFLKNMDEREYAGYLDHIESFLKGERSYPFTSECFAKTVMREIIIE